MRRPPRSMTSRSWACFASRLARLNAFPIFVTSCRSGLATRPASISNSRRFSGARRARCERSASIARSTRTQARMSSSASAHSVTGFGSITALYASRGSRDGPADDVQDRMLEYDTIMYQSSRRREGALALDLVRKIRMLFGGCEMAQANKIIITCAVTGSIHTPSMSASLPVTAKEIAEAAVGAAQAGAAIVHLHARNPVDGRPDQSPEAFGPFLREIKARSDVVVNLTTGGSPFMQVPERVAPASVWKPEVASLNMGSMNFGLFPMLRRFKEFRYDWEPQMLENSRDLVFRNSFKDIEFALRTLNETGARYEFECYDTSHLYNLQYFFHEGLVKPPLFIQTVFGILGGIGPHPEDVLHMKRTADRLFGSDYRWSVLGAGRSQMPIASMAAAMGGNVRVGLEDSLWIAAGKMAESNAQQVRQVRKIIEGLGREIATPDDARRILKLKGGSKVAF